jgi:hypothetical protein
MTTLGECLRLLEATAPGYPARAGWDRILERDYARLDLADTRTVKFAYLYTGCLIVDGGRFLVEAEDGVTLGLYPGDTLTQARALYGDAARVQRLLTLRESGWQLRPNFHFGFMEKGLTWTTSTLGVESYVAYWVERINTLQRYPREDWDTELARLIADGIFAPEDQAQFDSDFRKTQRQEAYPRPTVAVTRSWRSLESERTEFSSELRTAVREVLNALGENLTGVAHDGNPVETAEG